MQQAPHIDQKMRGEYIRQDSGIRTYDRVGA